MSKPVSYTAFGKVRRDADGWVILLGPDLAPAFIGEDYRQHWLSRRYDDYVASDLPITLTDEGPMIAGAQRIVASAGLRDGQEGKLTLCLTAGGNFAIWAWGDAPGGSVSPGHGIISG